MKKLIKLCALFYCFSLISCGGNEEKKTENADEKQIDSIETQRAVIPDAPNNKFDDTLIYISTFEDLY